MIKTMPVDPKLLRKLFAGGAVLALLVVSGFYLYGILKRKGETGSLPSPIPAELSQSTQGFTYSKSQGGRTLYTIHASRAEQYKQGGRYELHDVNIVVYGREGNRFDQIYGSDFIYDQGAGDVTSTGEVHIDLASNAKGVSRPDQAAPLEMKNPIHVKTEGLTFNQKTGLAQTPGRIEFRVPEANGSAVGATYDSHTNLLTLVSDVRVFTTDKQKFTITARSAVMTREPRRAVLESARMEQPDRTIQADRVTLLLREDDTVERALASGSIRGEMLGAKGFTVKAPEGEVAMGKRDQILTGAFSGGVDFASSGPSPAQGKAGRVLLDFGPKNIVVKAHLEDAVRIEQAQQDEAPSAKSIPAKSTRLEANAMDLFLRNGKTLERAVSLGPAQIVSTQGGAQTTLGGGQLQAWFNAKNRVQSVLGGANTKIVTYTPGRPDRATTSRDLTATFDEQGEIREAQQYGDFHYQEGPRNATSERASYTRADDTFTLTGAPMVTQTGDAGVTLTGDRVQINRKTNMALVQGNVKTTYTDLKPQPGGAMLASSAPIHVTGATMELNRNTGVARYTDARLWQPANQAANMVEAPVILFDRTQRSLRAESSSQARVACVFLEAAKDQSGAAKSVPVHVTADRLTYADADRKAVFTGNVVVRGSEVTMTGDTIQVFLQPQQNKGGGQIDHILALGNIEVQKQDQRATGNRLVYTAGDARFVMTASEGRRPSIFDAEHGQISGDSLTFYTHDDRVLIDSADSSHTRIQTRIRNTSKQ